MADIDIGKRAKSLQTAPKFDAITRVVLQVADGVEYTSGDDTGRTLILSCPWGSQGTCDNILALFTGYQYQPLTVSGAILDPAAELGDSVSVGGVRSGICTLKTKFGHKLSTDFCAPNDEELDHEYTYKSKSDRKYTRQLAQMTAELTIQADRITTEVTARESLAKEMSSKFTVQADQISAKVDAKSSNTTDTGTMEWALTPTAWTVKAGLGSEAASEVFKITKAGVTVTGTVYATDGEFTGKITANSGSIGGFDILSGRLSTNGLTFGTAEEDVPDDGAIYIGAYGIRMGNGFKVDARGNGTVTGTIHATDGYFDGTVYAGNIVEGGTNNKMSGNLLIGNSVSGSRLALNTVTTAYTSGGINTSLGYADYAHSIFNGSQYAPTISASSVIATKLYVGEFQYKAKAITVDGDTFMVLAYDV